MQRETQQQHHHHQQQQQQQHQQQQQQQQQKQKSQVKTADSKTTTSTTINISSSTTSTTTSAVLPPSITLSFDGEESVQAYKRRLKMMNFFSQQDRECFQVPPNRTVMHDHPHEGSLARAFASSKDDSRPLRRQLEFSSPKHMDYVSSSFLSSWRSEKSTSDVFSSSQKFSPLQLKSSSTASDSQQQQQQPGKQRSSSADSVRKLVARCTFLRIGRKFSSKSSTSNAGNKSSSLKHQPPPLAMSQLPSLVDCSEPECKSIVESPTCRGTVPWDLPPNYVDMIFGKEPTSSPTDAGAKIESIKLESGGTKLEKAFKTPFNPPTSTVAVKSTK